MSDYFGEDVGQEEVPDDLARFDAALYAQNLGETLRINEDLREEEGFYEWDIEERVDFMEKIQKNWQWAEEPDFGKE